jgi:hypothetical protein
MYATTGGVPRRSVIVAAVVGTVLNSVSWLKVVLTYAVPYCVSTYGAPIVWQPMTHKAMPAAEQSITRSRTVVGPINPLPIPSTSTTCATRNREANHKPTSRTPGRGLGKADQARRRMGDLWAERYRTRIEPTDLFACGATAREENR